jgi:hypothetical protein
MAHDQALAKVMQHLLKDDTQVYKQFVENESFKRFVGDMVYGLPTSDERCALYHFEAGNEGHGPVFQMKTRSVRPRHPYSLCVRAYAEP